jgi:hypothetical protein
MEGLPPTEAALFQHTKRAAFQSGYCWHRSLQPQQSLSSPSEWGWVKNDTDGDWKPLWTTIPVVADCCPELLKCGCKKGCSKRCKCSKAKAKCTALCNCDGQCNMNCWADAFYLSPPFHSHGQFTQPTHSLLIEAQ